MTGKSINHAFAKYRKLHFNRRKEKGCYNVNVNNKQRAAKRSGSLNNNQLFY